MYEHHINACVWTSIYMCTWSCELLGPLHRGILPGQLCAEMLQRLGGYWSLSCTSPHAPAQAAEQLGSSFVERAQGLLVGTTLTTSQQCVLQGSSLGGCVGQSFASWSRPPVQLCPLLGSSVHETWMLCREGHHNHQVSGAPVE